MSPREPDFEMIAFEQVKEFMRSILTTVREHATRESMYLQADMCFVELGDDSCTDHISHHTIGSREVVAQGIDALYYDIPNTDSLDKPASFTRHLPSLLSCRIFHNDTQLAEAAWIDWPFPLYAHNTDAAVQRAHEAFCDAVVSMTESQQPVGESRSSRSCTAETLLPYLKDRLVTIFMQLSQYTTAETDTPVNNMMQIASRFQSSVNYVPCSLDNPPKRPLAMEDDLMILDAQPPSFDKGRLQLLSPWTYPSATSKRRPIDNGSSRR
ncbi:hypothetical protein BC940DRAFT_141834 [Gongronella butleri]|nr:hypothetical protein BC940DRAFT_141834 [Gongronella butleri]